MLSRALSRSYTPTKVIFARPRPCAALASSSAALQPFLIDAKSGPRSFSQTNLVLCTQVTPPLEKEREKKGTTDRPILRTREAPCKLASFGSFSFFALLCFTVFAPYYYTLRTYLTIERQTRRRWERISCFLLPRRFLPAATSSFLPSPSFLSPLGLASFLRWLELRENFGRPLLSYTRTNERTSERANDLGCTNKEGPVLRNKLDKKQQTKKPKTRLPRCDGLPPSRATVPLCSSSCRPSSPIATRRSRCTGTSPAPGSRWTYR